MAITLSCSPVVGLVALFAAAGASAKPKDVGHIRTATAITQVFGDGQKLTGIAIEYDEAIDSASLSPTDYRVEGRTIVGVRAAASLEAGGAVRYGRYVIIDLAPGDAGASLKIKDARAGGGAGPPPVASAAASGPPRFGPRQIFTAPSALIRQVGDLRNANGRPFRASEQTIVTTATRNRIVDDFRQLSFRDPSTGQTLRYNLFVPKGYVAGQSYPLVLFMHDAGNLSEDATTTLKQGLGAVVWADPAEQAKHPAFVLAPQYAQVAVDDESKASSQMTTTVALVESIVREYGIDRSRLYTTGQSMGAMLSIAIDIAHPGLFAASYIVAGQWDPAKVAPLARQKMWIVVSQGDLRAYPGQNAITRVLEQQGARVERGIWDGTARGSQLAADVAAMEAAGAPINYTALRKGTVVPAGERDDGGSNHVNTWRIAYDIPGIRDWLFRQHR